MEEETEMDVADIPQRAQNVPVVKWRWTYCGHNQTTSTMGLRAGPISASFSKEALPGLGWIHSPLHLQTVRREFICCYLEDSLEIKSVFKGCNIAQNPKCSFMDQNKFNNF